MPKQICQSCGDMRHFNEIYYCRIVKKWLCWLCQEKYSYNTGDKNNE